MARLIVSAIARNFSTQLVIEVSVSGQDGKPTKKLKAQNFRIHLLSVGSGLTPSPAFFKPLKGVEEDPNGFYTLMFEETNLLPGHYVFAVAVTQPGRGGVTNQGQVIAVGDLLPV